MADRRAVIIGGGITGVLTARALALAGWDVVILEAAHLGAGSSSRTAAGIRQQFSTPETVRGMRFAMDFYLRFGDELPDPSPVVVQNGYLFLHGDAEAHERGRARVAMQRAQGLAEVELLDAAELGERFAWVDADAVVGGTYCPTDGFIHPHLIYSDGAERCRQLGVEIRQGTRVVGGARAGGKLQVVETTKGQVGGDVFIDCTNAFTRQLAPMLGLAHLPVAPLKRHLWFIQRDGSLDAEAFMAMPLVITPSGVYLRPENPDSLLVGWAHATAPEPDFTYEDQDVVQAGYAHNSGIDAAPYEAWMHAAEVLPPIGEFGGITATTAGFYGTTPDHNPFFGFDKAVPNVLRLVGFSGHGAMFGPFTARVAAAFCEAGEDLDTVELHDGPVDVGAFALDREFVAGEHLVI